MGVIKTATTTPLLGLRKVSTSDPINVVTDLDNNWDVLDAIVGLRAAALYTTSHTLDIHLDSMVFANAATASFTVTLPSASGQAGKYYTIKRSDNTPAHTVTINTTSAQTIDGVSSVAMTYQYNYLEVISDGSNWSVTAKTLTSPWYHIGVDLSSTYGSGWADGATGPPALNGIYFRCTTVNNIELKGTTVNGSAALGQTMFTLPVGFRPPVVRDLTISSRTLPTGSGAQAEVATTGVVTLQSAGTGAHTFTFDGAAFSIDPT